MLLTPWYIWTVWSRYGCLGNYNFELGSIYTCDFHWEGLLGFGCFLFSDRRWLIRVESQEVKRGVYLVHLCSQHTCFLGVCIRIGCASSTEDSSEVSTYLYCSLQRCSAHLPASLLPVALLPLWGGGPAVWARDSNVSVDLAHKLWSQNLELCSHLWLKGSISENEKHINKKTLLCIRVQLKELWITFKISGPLIDFILCSVFILRLS